MLLLLLACPHRAPTWLAEPPPDPALVALAFPGGPGEQVRRYVEHSGPDETRATAARSEERWIPGEAPWTWTVTLSIEGEVVSRTPYALGPEGLAWTHTGLVLADLPYDVPKVALPAGMQDGSTWSGVHSTAARTDHRRCRAERGSPFCTEGWRVTCATDAAGREILLREHWCTGEGWRGAEAVVRDSCAEIGVMWTSDVDLGAGPFADVPGPERLESLRAEPCNSGPPAP